MKAPFPFFGGKSRAAGLIWDRLGDTGNYVEPFAGSLAVLLNRPTQPGNEIVNDLNCYVANAWRAMKLDPDKVAEAADWPVNECDLYSRHLCLVNNKEFRHRMREDPDYFDPRVAGWWIWGLSCWIGSGWCDVVDDEERKVPHLTGGQGVARKVPHLTGGKGELSVIEENENQDQNRSGSGSASSAQTIPSKIPYLDTWRKFNATNSENIVSWFKAISNRLRFTKVCCGDWSRILTPAATSGQGVTGVLLDPPYEADGHDDDVYGDLAKGVSKKVRLWAIENGDNKLLRIALCGYDSEHEMPASWDCVAWKAAGGYGGQRENKDNQNSKRERIWFSPHCLKPSQPTLF